MNESNESALPGSDETLSTSDRTLLREATIVRGEREGAVTPAAPEAREGRYHLREVIGQGGMGEVRLCRDEAIGRDVALKTLVDAPSASSAALRRFMREVRVQGQLEHPSIVPLYDLGTGADGAPFFTMRRVRGHTLAEVISALAEGDAAMVASHSPRKLLEAFVRVCLAVDYAHSRGVIHRDLKPANIMLGDFGEVYLLDWGVARMVAAGETGAPLVLRTSDQSAHGSRVGTPGYMSPEQALGVAQAQDARTDVYALGAILFEILTLRRLHVFTSSEELLRATLSDPPALPKELEGRVPRELEKAYLKAIAKNRDERFATARELAAAVERHLDGEGELERRRVLAAERAKEAARAFEGSLSPDATAEASAAGRTEALRQVTASLALDPEGAEARRLLMRLFVEAPSRTPHEVEVEMAEAKRQRMREFVRYSGYGIFSWVVTIPFVIAMGVLSWPPVLFCSAMCTAAFAYAVWLRKRAEISNTHVYVLISLVFATIAGLSCWLGPFVLVPQACAITTLWIAIAADTWRMRWTAIAMGVFSVVGPLGLELVHAVPPSWELSGGNLVLLARAVRLSGEGTLPGLLWASIMYLIIPGAAFGRVREALSGAERQLFVQAWHLKQLLR